MHTSYHPHKTSTWPVKHCGRQLCWFVSTQHWQQVAKGTLLFPVMNVWSRPQSTAPSQSPPFSATWVQPPVTFPIDDYVNVLHDYKKMGPSKILKLLTCRCHHLIDIVSRQSLLLLTLQKYLNVPYMSMFTNFCKNSYAHVPSGEKIAKNPSAFN